jgi:hypothetical protein
MLDTLLALSAAVACYAGFALIALTQERHWEEVSGRAFDDAVVTTRKRAVWLGSALLGVALGLSLQSQGPSFGVLLWVTVVCAAAFGVAFTLSWRPQALKPLSTWLG